MRLNIPMLLGTTALVAALTAPGAVQAQNRSENQSTTGPQQSEQRQQQRSGTQQATHEMSDRDFVRQAAIVNMFEIQAGEMALNKSQDKKVREFAQQIISDHRRIQDQLAQAAGQIDTPSQLDRRHSNLINRLERSSDERFDRRFIRAQVRGHQQAVDLFESFLEAQHDQADSARRSQDQAAQRDQAAQQDGQRRLLQFAQQNLPALERHLKSAQAIRKDLRSTPDVAASRQAEPETANNRPQDGRSQQSRMQDGDDNRRFVVEQPRPRVTVTDPRSQVNIEQPQPRVTVRQRAPTVTIEQPPPEVVVHMPRPQVDVQNREPRVSVDVPRPQVSVEQQGEPARVQIQRRADKEEQVQYQHSRPQVQFERTGEPRVVYRPSGQEPTVRYESAQRSPAGGQPQRAGSGEGAPSSDTSQASGSQAGAQQAHTAQQQGQNERDWRERTRQLAGDEEPSGTTTGRARTDDADKSTTGRATSDASTRTAPMLVSQINDMPVYNGRGQKLGDVQDVVADETTDQRFVILESGGFLGMFEDEVALPIERFRASGDRLIVSGLSEQDIDNMQDWEDRLPNSYSLKDNQTVRLRR